MSKYYYDDYNYHELDSTEIYDLRRVGQLDKARQRAEEILRKNNKDQDVWKAYAWTLVDICKREKQNGNIDGARQLSDYLSRLRFDTTNDEFAETLVRKIQSLKLSLNPFFSRIQEATELSQNGDNDSAWKIMTQLAAEKKLPVEAHDNYGWIIYKYLRDHLTTLNSIEVRTLLRDYINLRNERPSVLHSQILNFALNYSKQDGNFKLVSFLKLWGPNNLRADDFDDTLGNDGKTIPSLMSRIARSVVNYPYEEIRAFVELLPRQKDDFIEMLREQFFWILYHSTDGKTDSTTWELFDRYLYFFPESSSSIWHSKILSLAERVMKDNNAFRFYDFFRRWNPSKLRFADWQEEKGDDGKSYKPLAIKSLKKAHESLDTLSNEQIGDLQWLIDLYGTAVEKFPEDDWIIRTKALLHLKAGQLAEAKKIYKELCMKMGEKYFIWSEFAECWKDNGVKIAMLCKALSLEKNEDLIGKIRLELARNLIKAKKFENAAFELNQYKNHYAKMGWRIDSEVDNLLQRCSPLSLSIKNNDVFYAENIPVAEEHTYADIPLTELVLVDKWKNDDGKEMLLFVDGNEIEFNTNSEKFPELKNCHKGQIWKFKVYKKETIKTVPSLYSWRPPTTEIIIKYIPLIAESSDKEDWLSLPENYGYVQHVNEEKKVYHIYTRDSALIYEHYENQELHKGDFVTFRQYKKRVKDEKKVFVSCVMKCDSSIAVDHFNSRIVVVDDVNNKKQLFHFELGPKLIGGIMHYEQTNLRPRIGDFLRIYYYVRVVDDKNNPENKKKTIEVIKAIETKDINATLVKEISGELELKSRNRDANFDYDDPDFAFIGDYYVHKSILDEYHIYSDCYVKAKVVYAGKGQWKVFEIHKQ